MESSSFYVKCIMDFFKDSFFYFAIFLAAKAGDVLFIVKQNSMLEV